MPHRHRTQAVTLIDTMIAGLMVALVGFVVLPALAAKTREEENRIKCGSNLRQIGLAMKLYANNEVRTTAYPRTRWDSATADKPTFYSHFDSPNPFDKDTGVDANDVTASLFLTLRSQDLVPAVFVCPSTKAEKFPIPRGKNVQFFSNFDSMNHLSYSMQNPFPTIEGMRSGFVWNDAMPADFAIMADMNPGGAAVLTIKMTDKPDVQGKATSPNHGSTGQNVLYADGHVDWTASPFAGMRNGTDPPDNIYTHRHPASAGLGADSAGVVGPPSDSSDSMMLPTWDDTVARPVIDFTAPSRK